MLQILHLYYWEICSLAVLTCSPINTTQWDICYNRHISPEEGEINSTLGKVGKTS